MYFYQKDYSILLSFIFRYQDYVKASCYLNLMDIMTGESEDIPLVLHMLVKSNATCLAMVAL